MALTEAKERVRLQFEKTAEAYVNSQVHTDGSDLALLPELAGITGSEHVLDVATGAGHTAFAFAPRVRRVVAIDLSQTMIAKAEAGARKRELSNMEFWVCDVDHLPFPDSCFDVVTCRIAAHHFPQLDSAVAEMSRVLRPGGRLLVVDNYAPADPALDQFINQFEVTRDPSHIRAHNLAEWEQVMAGADLTFSVAHLFASSHGLKEWVERAQTPPEAVASLRLQLQQASPEAVKCFSIVSEPELGFRLLKAILLGTKAR
ncbi:MAG: class I SAM-dependent methyltransferase [Mycobacterium leprae]